MAQAQLEIIIKDAGGSPIGAGAPPSAAISSGFVNRASPAQTATSGGGRNPSGTFTSAREGIEALATHAGFGSEVSAMRNIETLITKASRIGDAAAAGASGTAAGAATEGAAAGAGGLSGLATIAGPVAIAIGAVMLLARAVKSTAEGIDSAGKTIASAISGNALQESVQAGVGAFKTAMAAAGGATGKAIAEPVTAIVNAEMRAASALDEQAHTLSAFSSKLAGATAQADIRRTLAEMDRAGRVEDKLSEFENVYSKLETDAYKVWTSILQLLAEVFTPILEAIEPAIKLCADLLQIIVDFTGAILEFITGHLPTAWKMAAKGFEDIGKLLGDIAGKDDDNDLWKKDPLGQGLWSNFRGAVFGPQQGQPLAAWGAPGGA